MAAGVVLDVDPLAGKCVTIRATDLEVTYRQTLTGTADGEAHWRLPSALLAGILAGFPLTGTVALESLADNRIRITHGRSRATLHQLTGSFPLTPEFPSDNLVVLEDFAERASQVAWACHRDVDPKTGVHIDGNRLVATDGTKIALVPCVVPVESPITVPLATLAGLLKNTGAVRLGATEHKLLLMTDADTQMTSTIYSSTFPIVDQALRTTFDQEILIDRATLIEHITNMLVLVKTERYPLLKLVIGDGNLALEMTVPEVGLMEADMDIIGGALGSFTIWFTPQNLVSALSAATSQNVTLKYGPTALQSVSLVDGGYRADIMPRAV